MWHRADCTITSGTLSYALALGKPIVSTLYVHAAELLAGNHGLLVDFEDSAGFAAAISGLLGNINARRALGMKAYARGRLMIWPRFVEQAMDLLGSALERRAVGPYGTPASDSGKRIGAGAAISSASAAQATA